MVSYPLIAFFTLILAIILDLVLGDPPWKLHPTFLIGELTKALEPHFKSLSSKLEKLKGVLLVLIVLSLVVVPAYFGLRFIYSVLGFLVYILVAAVLLKLTLCIKLETKWAVAAAQAVDSKDLAEGRKLVTYFSRREAKDLAGPQIVSAIVESMAENLSDFKLASMFYYAFLGVLGALVVRAVNTIDSVIGFKDPEHINTGWFTATLDTLINYFPSRLSALLIVFASALLGEDWRGAWKIANRDHARITSINHGWPIAAMAGALRVQLEKPGFFVVGDEIETLSATHIMRTLRIRNVTIILCVILLLPVLFLTRTLFFPF